MLRTFEEPLILQSILFNNFRIGELRHEPILNRALRVIVLYKFEQVHY